LVNKRKITQLELIQHLNTLNYILEQKDIKLIKDFNFQSIYVDPDRFFQILTNLISNGIKFSSSGNQIICKIDGVDLNKEHYFKSINEYFFKQFKGDDDLEVNFSDFNTFSDFLNVQKSDEIQISYEYFLKKALKNHYIISVKDYGNGIDEKNIPLLFNKFCQISTDVRDAVGGTGLGLVISKYLVNLHGGEIFVESKINEFTEFYFLIPKEVN
ncbi:hypothetical protein HN836_02045, partial [Candidatus Woesearchaeota archaeon]|nr:hypothetical protein [Candidatus Woesearchaeota archaeon]